MVFIQGTYSAVKIQVCFTHSHGLVSHSLDSQCICIHVTSSQTCVENITWLTETSLLLCSTLLSCHSWYWRSWWNVKLMMLSSVKTCAGYFISWTRADLSMSCIHINGNHNMHLRFGTAVCFPVGMTAFYITNFSSKPNCFRLNCQCETALIFWGRYRIQMEVGSAVDRLFTWHSVSLQHIYLGKKGLKKACSMQFFRDNGF